MKTVWLENHLKDINTRAFFQIKCEKADKIEFVVLDYYNLYIDGEFYAFGPARCARGYARKEVFDLSKFKNFTLTLEVLSYNAPSYCLAWCYPMFGAEIFSDGKVVADTDDFKAYEVGDYIRKVQKYSQQRGFSENYVMENDRGDFYRGKEMFKRVKTVEVACPKIIDRNVDYPDYKPVNFDLVECGTFSIDPKAEHWYEEYQMLNRPDRCVCFEREEIEEYVSDTVCEFKFKKQDVKYDVLDAMQYCTYDCGRVIFGQFVMSVEVLKDAEIYIEWAQYAEQKNGQYDITFYRDSCCDIIKYKLKKGIYSLRSFAPYSIKTARVICKTGRIRFFEFRASAIENKNAFNLTFTCENKNLEKIVLASQNGFSHNAIDIFTDCPSRESGGYLCDSFFSGRAEKYLTGNNLVEKNFLENIVIAESFPGYPEGMIPMNYPSNILTHTFIPNWAMWFIVQLHDYIRRGNPRELVDRAKDKVYGLIKYFEKFKNELGLLENLDGWVFVEWSKANDYLDGVNIPTNVLYSGALKCAGELYNDKKLIDESESIKKTILNMAFNGEFFLDNFVRNDKNEFVSPNNISETCQYYVLFFGFAEGDEFKEFRNKMINEFGSRRDTEKVYPFVSKSNMFIGDNLRLSYLHNKGEYDRILKECEQLYSHMADKTLTLWEYEELFNSLDHGFASCAAVFILDSIQNSKKFKYKLERKDGRD